MELKESRKERRELAKERTREKWKSYRRAMNALNRIRMRCA